VRSRARAAGIVLGVLVASATCRSGAGDALVAVAPPADWRAGLLAERAEKDDYFRSSDESPLLAEDRASFRGLEYWSPDAAYHLVGPLNRFVVPERFTIVTTAGKPRPCERVGWVAFRIRDRDLRLAVYRLLDGSGGSGGEDLFLPFTDGTSGEETYPAGRYVELVGPPGGPYVLDFNRAYNPHCAYGAPERFACPVTPAENRLAVRIEAGERGYHHR
jgi:uncharacterized protein (DUF1684 family)